MRWAIAVLALAASLWFMAACMETPTASAHWKPGFHNQQHAIAWGFCHGDDRLPARCTAGREAMVVAHLESGDFHWYAGHCNRAVNGQYVGCFQMGSSERAKYGDGHSFWAQARAAFRYFVASGWDWSPWSCKPWGRCYG